jgi:hypothetical protein
VAVAELIAVPTATGQYEVDPEGIAEVVADKGYHISAVMVELRDLGLRIYVAEPERGPRRWQGKAHGGAAGRVRRSETDTGGARQALTIPAC